MRNWLKRWGHREQRHVTRHAAPLNTISQPDGHNSGLDALRDFLPLPNETPFYMQQVYRFLCDAIPDVSDGVWTWKRLCQTGYDIEIDNTSSNAAARRARRLLRELDARVNTGDRGMDGLLEILYSSLFTYGAAAFEIVLSGSRESIADVVPVDVWTVRFRRERNGRLQAYQVRDGQDIALPMERFIYVGLDRDGTNPYGRSMLRSIPFVVKVQQRLIEDMAKATHNAGWAKLHVSFTPGDKQRGESNDAYVARVEQEFKTLQSQLSGLKPDQNVLTYDNVKVELLRGHQSSQLFYENHKAIEEQVITGLHLMPILMGRNYGSTETYGTAQFELVNRQVATVNRSVKRLLERLYNFELALMWGEARAKVHMRSNRTVDALKEAQARGQEIDNVLRLQEAGVLTDEAVVERLGGWQ